MFCPQCKSEYREGFTKCADCGSPLVDSLPAEPEPEFIDYQMVLSTFNPADIAIIKSVLQTTDIVYFFQGEHFGYMEPLASPTRLMVKKDQVEEARLLIGELKLALSGLNLPTDRE